MELAKVLTIVDPRKPLPETVNVQSETGDICRVLVSCSWLPPICDFCKEVGHSIGRCTSAPITRQPCNSTIHEVKNRPRVRKAKLGAEGKKNEENHESPSVEQGREKKKHRNTTRRRKYMRLDKGKGITTKTREDYILAPPASTQGNSRKQEGTFVIDLRTESSSKK